MKHRRVEGGLVGSVYAGLLCVTLILSACGSTTEIIRPIQNRPSNAEEAPTYIITTVSSSVKDVPDSFVTAVRSDLETELQRLKLLGKDGTGNYAVQIQITDYRMRSGVARSLLGILAGSDVVKSNVKVIDRARCLERDFG